MILSKSFTGLIRVSSLQLFKCLGSIGASNFDQNGTTTGMIFQVISDIVDLLVRDNSHIVGPVVPLHFLKGNARRVT